MVDDGEDLKIFRFHYAPRSYVTQKFMTCARKLYIDCLLAHLAMLIHIFRNDSEHPRRISIFSGGRDLPQGSDQMFDYHKNTAGTWPGGQINQAATQSGRIEDGRMHVCALWE